MMKCRGMGAVTKKPNAMAKGKKIPGKLKGYAQGTPAAGYPRALTPYEQKIAKMSPWARKALEARAAAGPNPEKGNEAIANMSPYNRALLEKTGDVKPKSGASGTGITSGGAMARGMPTSGLPAGKTGVITVEETGMKRGGKVKFKKKAKAKMVKRKMKGKSC